MNANNEQTEPSLGPACLVIVIVGLAIFCAICAFGSFFMFSDQYPLAVRGIEQQLIPWVEQSQLDDSDKGEIVTELKRLLPLLEQRGIDREQLVRLRNCLQDNPVLLWGGVQVIEQEATSAGLNEAEITALNRTSQRLMRMAVERKLSRSDLEFVIQECADVKPDESGLVIRTPLSAEQIRQFMNRAEQLLNENNISIEPYELTPAAGFKQLVEMALDKDFTP